MNGDALTFHITRYNCLYGGLDLNEFTTLEDALEEGEQLLDQFREELFEEHIWNDDAFGIKIFDSNGHVYYISTKSGYKSGRDYMKEVECPDCELQGTKYCDPINCEKLDTEFDEVVDDVKFIRCNKELTSDYLIWFLNELEYDKIEFEAWK